MYVGWGTLSEEEGTEGEKATHGREINQVVQCVSNSECVRDLWEILRK